MDDRTQTQADLTGRQCPRGPGLETGLPNPSARPSDIYLACLPPFLNGWRAASALAVPSTDFETMPCEKIKKPLSKRTRAYSIKSG
jgi:hypothetical protein